MIDRETRLAVEEHVPIFVKYGIKSQKVTGALHRASCKSRFACLHVHVTCSESRVHITCRNIASVACCMLHALCCMLRVQALCCMLQALCCVLLLHMHVACSVLHALVACYVSYVASCMLCVACSVLQVLPDMVLRRVLHNLTLSQGKKMRLPESKPHIEEFIEGPLAAIISTYQYCDHESELVFESARPGLADLDARRIARPFGFAPVHVRAPSQTQRALGLGLGECRLYPSHPIRPLATDFSEHGLDRGCWDRPVHEYACFNDFFTRGLAVGARPIAEPLDDGVVVSAADCRLMVSTLSTRTYLACLGGLEALVDRP